MVDKLTPEQQFSMVNEVAEKIGIINDRLRIIEERTHQNREKIRIDDVKRLSIEVDELRRVLNDVVKTVQRMAKDLANTAKLSDVNVIEKVLDYFDPTRYLTEKDVYKIIDQRSLRE
jgi:predicted ATPase